MPDAYLLIGEITKPQGVRGELKARPITCDPERFYDLDEVYLEENGKYVARGVSVRSVGPDAVFFRMDGVETRDDAEKMRGTLMYIDREHAVELGDDENFVVDLIGCECVDTEGAWEGETMAVATGEGNFYTGEDIGYAGMPMDAVTDPYFAVNGTGKYTAFHINISDEALIDSLNDRLQELTQEHEESPVPTDTVTEDNVPDIWFTYGQEAMDGFVINVTDSEGYSGSYFLFDTILEDLCNGNRNYLSEEEYTELAQLLGLPT